MILPWMTNVRNQFKKEATNELAHPISSLKPHIEEYVQLVGEEIVDAKYNIFS